MGALGQLDPMIAPMKARVRNLLRASYYSMAFGRSRILGNALGAVVRRQEESMGCGDVPMAAGVWDKDYSGGRWKYLEGMEQVARYGVISGYIRQFKRNGAVLDVGCGTGVLSVHIVPHACSEYVGFDVSEAAIREAQARSFEPGCAVSFSAADANTYVPGRRFDVMVFNEVLYYVDEPFTLFERYRNHLADDGIIIICSFRLSPRAEAVRQGLEERYKLLEKVEIHRPPKSWACCVFSNARLGNK